MAIAVGERIRRDNRLSLMKGFQMASMIMNRTWKLSTHERRTDRRPASIICPVNFSERDLVALRYATQLAKQRRGKLVVVHVVSEEMAQGSGQTRDISCKVALTQLERFVPVQPGVQCEWIVLRGEVADQLVELAAGCESPQIVMATGGRKGAGRTFLGHAAESVVRQAPCPVVMVHDEDFAAVERNDPSEDMYSYTAS